MAERVDVVEEECDSWFCWCRDVDGWLLTRLSATAMRWSPGYPVLRFTASGEEAA